MSSQCPRIALACAGLSLLVAGCGETPSPTRATASAGTVAAPEPSGMAQPTFAAPVEALCTGGTCTCANGAEPCAGVCPDLESDPNHCGSCGNACSGGTCRVGTCVVGAVGGGGAAGTTDPVAAPSTPESDPPSLGGSSGVEACALPLTLCGAACVDTGSNPSHCGACAASCGALRCIDGACTAVKACHDKTTVSAPLVADFESYDGTSAASAWSFAFNAPAGAEGAVYAGLYEFNDGTGDPSVAMVDGNGGSGYAVSISNTEATDWGGAVGMWMTCTDAGAYAGLSFWVRGTVPGGRASLTLATESTSPPDETDPNAGGTCTSDCVEASATFAVSEDWTRVVLPWESLLGATANGASLSLDGDDVTGLTFSVGLEWMEDPSAPGSWIPRPSAYELQLDDIEFISGDACPAGQTLCDSTCVDTGSSETHCGRCDDPCLAGRTCEGGLCSGDVAVGDAATMAGDMGLGANIGNTLENTTAWETGWGAPLITRAFIEGMASQGIRTVRLPVAWDTYADNGVIPSDQLARVREVVEWVLSADMYCILNIHWDGGWIRNEGTNDAYTLTDDVRAKFESYWEQIAAQFVNLDGRLVLEGMNEEGEFYVDGDRAGAPDYAPLNELNQLFVDTVRAAGGHNATRNLLIAGFVTDIQRTAVGAFAIPTDPAGAGKLFLSIHYYTPFPFTLQSEPSGGSTPRTTWGSAEDRAELDGLFALLGEFSNDRNVPVILGEFTVTQGSDPYRRESASRIAWLTAVIQAATSYGMVPVLWDTGEDISRSDGSLSSDLAAVVSQL